MNRLITLSCVVSLFTVAVLGVSSVSSQAPPAVPEKKPEAKSMMDAKPMEEKAPQAAAGGETLSATAGLIQAIEQRNAELSKREEHVAVRERQIQEMEKEVSAMLERYTLLREEVERKQQQLDDAQEQKYATLAKTYAAMSPEEASIRLEQMEEALALNILSRSKPKIAAKLLSGITPAKAAKLSLRLVKPPR
jgi:flagellar motility protein MotE (MotC chaperone)